MAGVNRFDLRFDGSSVKLLAGPGIGPPRPENGIVVRTSGKVGIGTVNPVAKLEVVGQDALRLIGEQPFLTLLDDHADYAAARIQCVAGEYFSLRRATLMAEIPTPAPLWPIQAI